MGRLGESIGRVLSGPVKALIPKNPWLRIALVAVPVLLVLALLEPVLRLFEKGIDLVTRLLAPLLETPGGRLLLLNALLLIAVAIAFVTLRSRLRRFRSGLVLRRHLDAVAGLFGDEPRRARDGFRRVARSRAVPPSEFPAIVEHAKLELARLALEVGDADRAIRELTRVRERDLPKELRRGLAQLRGEAFLAQGEVDAGTLTRELLTAVEKLGADARLCALLRELAVTRGDHAEAVAMQEKVAKLTTPRRRSEARRQLLRDMLAAGDAELAAGRTDAARAWAKRAQKVDPDSAGPAVLLGRVRLAEGDARAAVKEWGKSRSPAGLTEIAKLLDARPGVISPRELLEACPLQGTVLLVAREYARAGDTVRAERAARTAARELGATPSAAAVLAEVLELCGREQEARQVTEEAVRRLVAPEPSAG